MRKHFIRILYIATLSHFGKRILALILLSAPLSHSLTFSQNVGIGIASSVSKLHIKGSENVSQLCIDADTIQTNIHPLIRLRSHNGTDLMWIHADNSTNVFIGVNSGRVNSGGGVYNTFIGKEAGYSNTTGEGNTAIGNSSFFYNTTGNFNSAFGHQALFYNTGSKNTAI